MSDVFRLQTLSNPAMTFGARKRGIPSYKKLVANLSDSYEKQEKRDEFEFAMRLGREGTMRFVRPALLAIASVVASPFATYYGLSAVSNLSETDEIIVTTLLTPYTALVGILGSVGGGLMSNRRARRKLDAQINPPASPEK
jgi:hypothetical protein